MAQKDVSVTVNGEAKAVRDGTTIAELLGSLGLKAGGVAVELDREIVPRPEYGARALRAGAVLEIVHFVGGG